MGTRGPSRENLGHSFLTSVQSTREIESVMEDALAEKTKKGYFYRTKILLEEKTAFDDNFCCSRSIRWIQYSFWTFLALMIEIIFGAIGNWAFPDGRPACHRAEDGTILLITTTNKNMCGLSKTLERTGETFNFLAAFIIGGFILSSVQIWLKRRRSYIDHCNATRNLLIVISSIVEDEDEKTLLIRWIILGYELAVMKGRKLIDSNITREYLEDLHLLEQNEWETMVNGERHTTVWYWILKKSKKLLVSIDLSNNITDFEFQTIHDAVAFSRDKASDLMMCVSNDQPPPYIYVCAFLININLILYAIESGVRWAIMSFDAGGGFLIWKEPRMYVEVLLLYFYTSIFALLFDVTTILYNPFGSRPIDIKHYQIGAGIRSFAKRLQQNEEPDTMNPIVHDEQQSKKSTRRRSFFFEDDETTVKEKGLQKGLEMGLKVKQSEHALLKTSFTRPISFKSHISYQEK